MPTLTYNGGAKDHAVEPGVLAKGDRDGKSVKRVYAREAKTKFFDIETYDLYGQKFPKGEAVDVSDPALVRKALVLGFFSFDGPDKWLEVPKGRARELRRQRIAEKLAMVKIDVKEDDEKVGSTEDLVDLPQEPKKRGRPKKVEADG